MKTNKYRPQIHFAPQRGWINDPNGLVYDEFTKTYHLFVQYSKDVENNGIFGWLHATSKDLINWEEIDVPILSNSKGAAWSGGAVLDRNNTSGLFNESIPSGSRMICFVTYQSNNPKIGIVYSLDFGKTWLEYGRFVIENEDNKYSNEFRDPKVIWYENALLPNGGKWLLIVGGFTTIKLFSSSNLLDWTFESEVLDINGKTVNSECPDILKMFLDGNSNVVKYVVVTAGTSYIVGNLSIINNKIVFKGEQEAKPLFKGPSLWTNKGELYATQSFFNDENHRTILMSWVVDRTAAKTADKNWNGFESLPLEAKLQTRDKETLLNLYPVEELDYQRGKTLLDIQDYLLTKDSFVVIKNTNNKYDFEIEIETKKTDGFVIFFGKSSEKSPKLIYESTNHVLRYIPSADDDYEICDVVLSQKDILKLRIIMDVDVAEIYINDGETNFHTLAFLDGDDLEIKSLGCEIKIVKARMYSFKDI